MSRNDAEGIKRVVFFCDFFNNVGGVECHNASLLRGLRERGIEVLVYIGEKPRLEYWNNVLDELGVEHYEPETYHADLRDDVIETGFIAEHAERINQWSPDVIYAHPFKKLAIAWLKNPNADSSIPIVANEYTTPGEHTAHWFSADTSRYIGRASSIIVNCQVVEDGVRAHHGYGGTIHHIPHLLPPAPAEASFSQQQSHLSAGCISRLSPEKGIDFLIGGWKQVHSRFPAATLHIYGHGDALEHLRSLRDSLGLSEVIFFEGVFAPHGGIDQVAARHDIFVQPSIFEGLPTSVVELMMRGQAVIGTNVGGIPEILNNSNGRLIEPASTSALADSIIELFGAPDRVAALGRAARRDVRAQHGYEEVLSRIVAVLDEARSSSLRA
ncbi:MAG: putative glycosyltransferase [Amycolatopsis sp.]|uniref:glycosyltransferase family 4 protein n=1 Tax=Amycolatopsis sp. TaxID=37632 RepID=UPI0026072744|nr:glycosyltransferase family 4 protein [Amycolatopsis sp.]MCU1679832.1 putative glycosyltransferase [Amycolatopsis sp.]